MKVKTRPTVIGIGNLKGGVGKTTATINLAIAMAYLGVSVGVYDAETEDSMSAGEYDLAALSSFFEIAALKGHKVPVVHIRGARQGTPKAQADSDYQALEKAMEGKGSMEIIFIDFAAKVNVTEEIFKSIQKFIVPTFAELASWQKAQHLISKAVGFSRAQDMLLLGTKINAPAQFKEYKERARENHVRTIGSIPAHDADRLFAEGLCLASFLFEKGSGALSSNFTTSLDMVVQAGLELANVLNLAVSIPKDRGLSLYEAA